MSDLERGWESISVVVSGPVLKSKMKRRIKRVELGVLPLDYDPNKPQPHWNGIGSCGQASSGVLRPSVNPADRLVSHIRCCARRSEGAGVGIRPVPRTA
jgi:hypothetical protein